MKKILAVMVLCTAFVLSSHAQKGQITISPGLELGLPIGNFGETTKFGIGVTAKGLYGLNDESDVTFTLGFIRFGAKGVDGEDGVKASTSLIPLMPGYRYKFNEQFYGEGQLGLTIVRSKVNVAGWGGVGGGINASTTNFGYALGVGYMLGKIDLGLRYQGVSAAGGSLSLVGIRAAYNIAL